MANIYIPDFNIKISENIQNSYDFVPASGICVYSDKTIIIKRSELSSLSSYAGTLVHEAVHASTKYSDVSRDFESALSKVIGVLCVEGLGKDLNIPIQKKSEELKDKFNILAKPLDEKFVNEELTSIIKTLKNTIKWDKLQKEILYFVIFPIIPAEYYNLYTDLSFSYDYYLEHRKSIDWVSDIPTVIKNLEYLYSLPPMNQQQFDSIYEYVKVVDYISYKKLYKQSRSLGLMLTKETICSILVMPSNDHTIKQIYNTYKYLLKRYRRVVEQFHQVKTED